MYRSLSNHPVPTPHSNNTATNMPSWPHVQRIKSKCITISVTFSMLKKCTTIWISQREDCQRCTIITTNTASLQGDFLPDIPVWICLEHLCALNWNWEQSWSDSVSFQHWICWSNFNFFRLPFRLLQSSSSRLSSCLSSSLFASLLLCFCSLFLFLSGVLTLPEMQGEQ